MTKYRTRQTRAKTVLQKSSKWANLSESQRVECLKDMAVKIESERETELQAAAREWIQLAYGHEVVEKLEREGEGKDGSQSSDDSEIEEWNGIQDADNNDKWEGIHVSIEDSKGNASEEASEDEDIDVSDSEIFLDETGKEIEKDLVIEGLKDIWRRHWQKLEKNMDL